MRRLVLAALTVGLLAAPAVAEAAPYIRGYSVTDTGPRIVHKVRWCTGPLRQGYEFKGLWTTRIETYDGDDRQVDNWGFWYDRGCYTTRLSYNDQTVFAGQYYGRIRLRLDGQDAGAGWVDFYVR